MFCYLPAILKTFVGLSEEMSLLLTTCNAISYMISAGLDVLLVERIVRCGLMITMQCGVVSLFSTSVLTYSKGLYGQCPLIFLPNTNFFHLETG